MISFLSEIISLPSEISMFIVISVILGGLGMFLFGINIMSSSLNSLAGSKLKQIVSKATKNIFSGFLIGVLMTILIQSSSATTVIVVGLISAGLLDLKHAIPIMTGAHIGTTVLAYIISIDIISNICLPLIFIGSFIILLFQSRKWKLGGRITAGLGFIFFGLEMMSVSFGYFATQSWFENLMITLSNNVILSFFCGLVLTALIQSSGAFIGIVQELYITTPQMLLISALALVIGSNIGTTITAIIASLGSNKESKKAAIANTLIVAFGALITLPLIYPINELFMWLENILFDGERKKLILALFHTFFNIINSAFALLLLNYIIIVVNKLVKNKNEQTIMAENLNKELLKSPSLALENVKVAMEEMNDLVLSMYDHSVKYFDENNKKFAEYVDKTEEKVDLAEHLIHDYLMQISQTHLTKADSYTQTRYLDIIRDFERIADHAVNFTEFLDRYYSENTMMSDAMHNALYEFFMIVRDQINDASIAFKDDNKELAHGIIEREKLVNNLEVEYRRNVHSYLKVGEVSQLDILYIDIISNLERISDHTTNIAEMIIDPHMMLTMVTGEKQLN